MTGNEAIALSVFVLANFCAAMTGGIFRPGKWYENLKKPSWRPPKWLFAPVWSILYVMIAVSGWLVWRTAGLDDGAQALTIYGVQLVLNGLWSAVFFGMKRIGLAFFELVALWVAIVVTIFNFYPINPTAAYMLVPYLLWGSFAGGLNFTVWQMNKSQPAPRG